MINITSQYRQNTLVILGRTTAEARVSNQRTALNLGPWIRSTISITWTSFTRRSWRRGTLRHKVNRLTWDRESMGLWRGRPDDDTVSALRSVYRLGVEDMAKHHETRRNPKSLNKMLQHHSDSSGSLSCLYVVV